MTNRIGDVQTEEEPVIDYSTNKLSNRIHDGNTYYWSLPQRFLGNQLRSYGGFLTFTIENDAYGTYTPDQDIIIRGNGLTLVWTRGNPDEKTTSARFKETEWQSLDRGGPRIASRADLLTVLSNLEAILIRATLKEGVSVAHLSDVALDTAVQQQTGQETVGDVEICRCPEGYTGTSCEVSDFFGKHIEVIGKKLMKFWNCSHAITSTIATLITAQLVFWEHVAVAHVKMPIRAQHNPTDELFAIADQTTLAIDAPVSFAWIQSFISFTKIHFFSNFCTLNTHPTNEFYNSIHNYS